MIRTQSHVLVKLGDAGLKIADRDEDVQGRIVVDLQGADIGKVKDLLVDTDVHKVRFLEIETGGFMGLGTRTFLVPVAAIAMIESHKIHVDLTGKAATVSPVYDPVMIPVRSPQPIDYRGPLDTHPVYPRYPHDWR